MERLTLRLEAAVLQDWAAKGCILRRRNEGESRGRPQQEAEPSGAENNGAPLRYCYRQDARDLKDAPLKLMAVWRRSFVGDRCERSGPALRRRRNSRALQP